MLQNSVVATPRGIISEINSVEPVFHGKSEPAPYDRILCLNQSIHSYQKQAANLATGGDLYMVCIYMEGSMRVAS